MRKQSKNKERISVNFNNNRKEEKTQTIILTIIILIAFAFVVRLYIYIKEEKRLEIEDYNKKVLAYNKQVEENIKNKKENHDNNQYDYEHIEKTETSLKFDNNLYGNRLYSIHHSLYNNYRDSEFLKNLEPFFDNLTVIRINKEKIHNFEIKGLLTRYGNFTYIIYKRTNIQEYDNQIIKELERLKKIKFREQIKDIDFSMTITNKYHLIK